MLGAIQEENEEDDALPTTPGATEGVRPGLSSDDVEEEFEEAEVEADEEEFAEDAVVPLGFQGFPETQSFMLPHSRFSRHPPAGHLVPSMMIRM